MQLTPYEPLPPPPILTIPTPTFVIPAKAGTHGGGAGWGPLFSLSFLPRRRESIPLPNISF